MHTVLLQIISKNNCNYLHKYIYILYVLGAMVVAIGEAATGVFSTSDVSWSAMESAGHYTGDRMWRFPLWNYYSALLKGTNDIIC